MKAVIGKAILFCLLALAVSLLVNCGGAPSVNTSDNTAVANANSTVTADANKPAKEKTPSEYPAIASAIDQAEIKKLDGSTFRLADKRGKVVLVNMWATWCAPCRKEMPHLVKMQDQYRDKDFEIIGVDVDDEPKDTIDSFAAEMKLNYTLGWSDTTLQTEFLRVSKFDGVPQSFLIDRDGYLRGVFLGGGGNVVNKMLETVEKVVNE